MEKLKLADDFKEFLRLLARHGVKYLLIGGYAVGVYGYVRPTGDLGVWIAVEAENADRLVVALKEFGFGLSNLKPELFLDPKGIVRMGVPPLRLKILAHISGVDFETCYQDRVAGKVDGVAVDLISLEHLKHNKAASGRFKDLDDLEHLGGSSTG